MHSYPRPRLLFSGQVEAARKRGSRNNESALLNGNSQRFLAAYSATPGLHFSTAQARASSQGLEQESSCMSHQKRRRPPSACTIAARRVGGKKEKRSRKQIVYISLEHDQSGSTLMRQVRGLTQPSITLEGGDDDASNPGENAAGLTESGSK